jgi:16S rRNA (guanine966-N2)-methyltransferase
MLAGSIWLDAFAGTGAVGIEALSRGAKHVVFNDRDRSACKAVEDNLIRCGVTTGFSVLHKDVFVLLRTPPPRVFSNRPLDILFLDPPYDFGRYHKLLKKALSSQVIDEKTLVILELFKKEKLDFIPTDLSIRQTLKAGDSHLLFLSRSGAPA